MSLRLHQFFFPGLFSFCRSDWMILISARSSQTVSDVLSTVLPKPTQGVFTFYFGSPYFSVLKSPVGFSSHLVSWLGRPISSFASNVPNCSRKRFSEGGFKILIRSPHIRVI